MIDIHSHILPGIDDGSKNMEVTEKMLLLAVEEGIHGIVATPHYEAGLSDKWCNKCIESYKSVVDYIESNNIPIELYLGNEIYYSESTIEDLRSGKIKTMNGTRYILVEFPIYADYMYIERAIRNLQNVGYMPIIAHVERYESLRNVNLIKSLVNVGAYIQVNASSVSAKTKWSIRMFCLKLMRERLIHLIATDSHGIEHRKPEVSQCFEYIDKKMGKAYRRLISERNPNKILEGEKIRE